MVCFDVLTLVRCDTRPLISSPVRSRSMHEKLSSPKRHRSALTQQSLEDKQTKAQRIRDQASIKKKEKLAAKGVRITAYLFLFV